MDQNNKKVMVTGIKPTGDLTLGNYIGALVPFVNMQDKFDECYFFVADLHALTTGDIKPSELHKNRRDVVAFYLACGLDLSKVNIFYQSEVMEHGMIQWLLTCETAIGELERMTQFKDKSQKMIKQANGTEKIPTGLLIYPTLMAGDIILYDADAVPVGEDQTQHLELTRTLIKRINKRYKLNFKTPKSFIPEVGARVKSLSDPTQKMSKSEKSSKSTIYLFDEPREAYNKILKAVTDSENKIYVSEEKQGVLNLLNIYAALKKISLEDSEKHFINKNYKELKEEVGQLVFDLLTDIQTKYKLALEKVDEITEQGAKKARVVASQNLNKLMKNMGFK